MAMIQAWGSRPAALARGANRAIRRASALVLIRMASRPWSPYRCNSARKEASFLSGSAVIQVQYLKSTASSASATSPWGGVLLCPILSRQEKRHRAMMVVKILFGFMVNGLYGILEIYRLHGSGIVAP